VCHYGILGGMLALTLCYGIDLVGYAGGPDGILAHERERGLEPVLGFLFAELVHLSLDHVGGL
jgi:hypothetical protein